MLQEGVSYLHVPHHYYIGQGGNLGPDYVGVILIRDSFKRGIQPVLTNEGAYYF